MMTFFWVVIVAIILLALLSGKGKGKRPAGSGGQPVRIDHPHLITEDACECSVCGRRFPDKCSVCPFCGTRFTGSREDYGEFDEEEEEQKAWDEEDGF